MANLVKLDSLDSVATRANRAWVVFLVNEDVMACRDCQELRATLDMGNLVYLECPGQKATPDCPDYLDCPA